MNFCKTHFLWKTRLTPKLLRRFSNSNGFSAGQVGALHVDGRVTGEELFSHKLKRETTAIRYGEKDNYVTKSPKIANGLCWVRDERAKCKSAGSETNTAKYRNRLHETNEISSKVENSKCSRVVIAVWKTPWNRRRSLS